MVHQEEDSERSSHKARKLNTPAQINDTPTIYEKVDDLVEDTYDYEELGHYVDDSDDEPPHSDRNVNF